MLNLIDEFTHECLAIRVGRRLKATDVIDVLSDLFLLRGVPGHVRSDNGPTTGRSSRPRRSRRGSRRWAPGPPTSPRAAPFRAATAALIPAGPDRQRRCRWEDGFVESFNARLRDELLDGEIFYSLREAEVGIESWRRHYNALRPHASLGYRAPAPEVFVPALAARPRPAPPAVAARPVIH